MRRLPGRLHITWQDEQTLRMDTDAGKQTRMFHFGNWTAPAGLFLTTSRLTGDPVNNFQQMRKALRGSGDLLTLKHHVILRRLHKAHAHAIGSVFGLQGTTFDSDFIQGADHRFVDPPISLRRALLTDCMSTRRSERVCPVTVMFHDSPLLPWRLT